MTSAQAVHNADGADHLRCGHLTYYRIAPGRPVGVPVWEFKE